MVVGVSDPEHAAYLESKLSGLMEALVSALIEDTPEEIEDYIIRWLLQYASAPFVAPNARIGAEPLEKLRTERETLSKRKLDLELCIASSCSNNEASYDAIASRVGLRVELSAPLVIVSPRSDDPLACESTVSVAKTLQSSTINASSASFVSQAPLPLPMLEQPGEPIVGSRTSSAARDECWSYDPEDRSEVENARQIIDTEVRIDVRAHSVSPQCVEDWTDEKRLRVHKAEEDRMQLSTIIGASETLQVLFGHLSNEDLDAVIGAFVRIDIASNQILIRQGEEGYFVYIVKFGCFNVLLTDQVGTKLRVLFEQGAGACFGEFALVYERPHTATVVASKAGEVWALDRDTFRMALTVGGDMRHEREAFLEKVDILKYLSMHEMAPLCDVLPTKVFNGGNDIIVQGDVGDEVFIVLDGGAKAFIGGLEVKHYKVGDYFGELALFTRASRRATVRALAQGCKVLTVNSEDFYAALRMNRSTIVGSTGSYTQYAYFIQREAGRRLVEAKD